MRDLIDIVEAYNPNETPEEREARMEKQRATQQKAADDAAAILGVRVRKEGSSLIVSNERMSLSFHVWGGASVEIKRVDFNQAVAFAQWESENPYHDPSVVTQKPNDSLF